MIKKIFGTLYLVFILAQAPAQIQKTDSLTLMFVGDMMNHSPQIQAAYNAKNNTYQYTENFARLDSIFHQADIVMANLETTLGVKPYSGYPQFSAPKEFVEAAKQAGINLLATANNHSCDKRKRGIINTLYILDTLQIKHFGTYRNQKEKDSLSPLIIEKKGFKLAFLNYTYGTNGLPVPYPTKVNKIDKKAIKKDLIKAQSYKPDAIIVVLHWGNQYQNKPTKAQQKLADWLHKNGAQIVIGSHPHVVQANQMTMDSISHKQNVTVYSLGNFISNQRKFPRDGSMIVKLQLIKTQEAKNLQLIASTMPIWVYKYVKNLKRHYEILPVDTFQYLPDYFQKNTDYQKMMRYLKHYQKIVEKKSKQ